MITQSSNKLWSDVMDMLWLDVIDMKAGYKGQRAKSSSLRRIVQCT
jgi:hypothetical protein